MVSFFQKFTPEGIASKTYPAKGTQQRLTKREEGIPFQEVTKHNIRTDCWVVIENKVYDVTSFVEKHPGGDVLLSYAGADATDVYEAFHADNTSVILRNYYIGDVKDLELSPEVIAYRELKKKLKQYETFESNKLYYVYKFFTNVSILTLSIWIAAHFQSTWRLLFSGVLMGLFWQQCGWLSHDFLHHQVFKNRLWNNYVGYLVGNIFQGFSVSWWKNKHNLHHAVPNIAGFDPDIDTLPFLAWSEKLIENDLEGLPRFLVKYQQFLYWPLLSFARISWLIQSFFYAKNSSPAVWRKLEVSTLLIHYTWFLSVMVFYMSPSEALMFLLVSQASTGLLLATAFSLGHNGMTIYPKGSQSELSFARLQIQTGRDVRGFSFVHWFMGGLDKQIEHHLFPKIPRHNLADVKQLVADYSKKFDIHYHETNFWDGTVETINRLSAVSKAAEKSSN